MIGSIRPLAMISSVVSGLPCRVIGTIRAIIVAGYRQLTVISTPRAGGRGKPGLLITD